MRFNKLDLNLLVTLDALVTERSIHGAATRLNLSPSATSNALSRLRTYFDDELLVQVGRKMELTPRALSLQESVRDLLVRVDCTIATQPEFVPSASDRNFRIYTSDYSQVVFWPHVLAIAREQRCTATFEFVSQVFNPQRGLERGEADLLLIPQGFTSPEHPEEWLFDEDFVCIVWSEGALARGEFSFDRYAAASHVVMRPTDTYRDSFENMFIKRNGFERRVAVTTFGFTVLPSLVVGTDHAATLHRRLARLAVKSLPLLIRPNPMPMAKLRQSVQWHKYRGQDPGLVWLRQVMKQAVARMDAAPVPVSHEALGVA